MRNAVVAFRKPSEMVVREFLDRQRELKPTYAENGEPEAGFNVDQSRVRLGAGREVFRRASLALRSWAMFRLGWVELCWPETPIVEGAVVGVLAHRYGLWTLSACRVVHVEDVPHRFRFAYVSLPGHIACGVEAFTVEQEESGAVWFEIYAISQPRHILARIGRIFTRRAQRRFARESLAAMTRAVR